MSHRRSQKQYRKYEILMRKSKRLGKPIESGSNVISYGRVERKKNLLVTSNSMVLTAEISLLALIAVLTVVIACGGL